MIIFSCILLMPYADLRTRESDGDRSPAVQRIDGPLWQSSNSYPRTMKNLNYNLSCSIIFSCTLCFQIFRKYKRTYETDDGSGGLATVDGDRLPHPSSQLCTTLFSCSCVCVDQIPKHPCSEYGGGDSLTTQCGSRPPLPSPQSCINYYLLSCSCTNLLLYIPLILSYLHNEERGEIKDGDGGLTFQRKDGPPWQSSNLHLIVWKESVIIFSCSFLMSYADLNRRESESDRGPATQRIDGPL